MLVKCVRFPEILSVCEKNVSVISWILSFLGVILSVFDLFLTRPFSADFP